MRRPYACVEFLIPAVDEATGSGALTAAFALLLTETSGHFKYSYKVFLVGPWLLSSAVIQEIAKNLIHTVYSFLNTCSVKSDGWGLLQPWRCKYPQIHVYQNQSIHREFKSTKMRRNLETIKRARFLRSLKTDMFAGCSLPWIICKTTDRVQMIFGSYINIPWY